MFLSFIRSLDKFGYPIGVTYRGSGEVQTRLGGLLSVVMYSMLLFFLVGKVTEFFDKSTQQEST